MIFDTLLNTLNNNFLTSFIIQTAIPFAIPFILEIPDNHVSSFAKMIMIIVISVVDLSLIFLLDKKKNCIDRNNYNNQMIRKAYSNVYELNERKRNYLVACSYDSNFTVPKSTLPYNIREYIVEICVSLKNLISQLVSLNKEYVSVSFIYRYIYNGANDEDRQWRWILGKEPTTLTPLNQFVDKLDTVYYELINGDETVVFYNDKDSMSKKQKYHMSARDERHNRVGSIMGIQMMFANNGSAFTEGILVVSTYGKRFVENQDKDEINELKRLIIDDIFPQYQRILEAELGTLYLCHRNE